MADLARIKSNVAKMVEMDAPEADVDAYIAEEGVSIDEVRNFQPETPEPESGIAGTVGRGVAGLGAGLLKAGVGVIQTGAQVVGADDWADAAGEVTKKINRNLKADRLGTAGKVGAFVGETAPYLALPASAATTMGRVALGAAGGGLAGGLQAQEDPNLMERGQSAVAGAVIGAAIPAGAAGVTKAAKAAVTGSKTAATGFASRAGEQLDSAATALKDAASASYKAARESGATLARPAGVNIANKVAKAVGDTGKLNARLHGDTLSVMQDFDQAVRSGNIGLEELDQFRQLFGDVVKRNTTKLDGANADAHKASVAIEAIDDAVEALGKTDVLGGNKAAVDTLLTARGQWQTYRKFEAVSNVVKAADGDPNKIKSGLQRLLANPKRLRGYSKQEITGLKEAAQSSTAELIAKGVGRFGYDPSNVFMPLVGGGIVGFGSGAGAGAALVVTGTGARYLHKLLGRGKAEKVLQLIEKGGEGQALVRSIAKTAGAPKAQQALKTISQHVPDESVRAQFQRLADESGKITRSPKTVDKVANVRR